MSEPEPFRLDEADRASVERQIGRPVRGRARVAARCPCGLPSVLETHPIADGVPFPTLYWLTCRRASAAIGGLEASGFMRTVNERLATDAGFRAAFDAAQRDYIQLRDELHRIEAGGVGGGPLDRVKCLHAHYAHHVAGGANPVGQWVEDEIGPLVHPPPCVETGP